MTDEPTPLTNEAKEKPKMTMEEYEKARKDEQAHFKKEIAWLKTEAEYEKLQADIEEHKARRISMIAQQARFYAAQEAQQPTPPVADNPTGPPAEQPTDKKPPRKLKTEK